MLKKIEFEGSIVKFLVNFTIIFFKYLPRHHNMIVAQKHFDRRQNVYLHCAICDNFSGKIVKNRRFSF